MRPCVFWFDKCYSSVVNPDCLPFLEEKCATCPKYKNIEQHHITLIKQTIRRHIKTLRAELKACD